MTVYELIKKLCEFPPETTVKLYQNQDAPVGLEVVGLAKTEGFGYLRGPPATNKNKTARCYTITLVAKASLAYEATKDAKLSMEPPQNKTKIAKGKSLEK